MQYGNKDKEVKTHIPTPDFKEFIENLSEDNLSRSEFMRIKIEEYNISKRSNRKSNVLRLFPR